MRDACQEIIANHKLNVLLLDKKNSKANDFLNPFRTFTTENAFHVDYHCSLLCFV